MKNKKIKCALVGAQEKDLYVLSELHRQDHVRISFIFDPKQSAVGLEIAEILGIPSYYVPELIPTDPIDYVVVSEPRERFTRELERLAKTGAKTLTQAEALSALCAAEKPGEAEAPHPAEAYVYTIEDALLAFEKLFDRNEMLKFLLDTAVKAAKASAGSIMLYSKDAEELYIAYATGLSERIIKSTRQKLGEGIAGVVAQEKKGKLILRLPDAGLYARGRERMDVHSAISLPLLWQGSLLGVLNVSSGRTGPELNENDLETLKRLSRRISKVLHESLKLQEIQIRHREMSLRYSVGELSEKPISPHEKFSLLSRLLSDLLGAATSEIYICTHAGDWFILGGSNRILPRGDSRILLDKGALSRCLLERRTIILTESTSEATDPVGSVSSLAFVPVALKEPLGALVLEFTDRYKLDEFMLVKDSISLEIFRFVASILRERRLKRELDALAKVSDFAPTLLACKSAGDLSEMLARLVAEVLECRRVSVRLLVAKGQEGVSKALHEPPGERSDAWKREDEERFGHLREKKEPYSLAFLNPAETEPEPQSHRSLLAVPIISGEAFHGGIIAYDKRTEEPLDDAMFTELDRMVMRSVISLVHPLLSTLTVGPAEAPSEEAAYETVLQDNYAGLKKLCENEMSRSDRYHHSFSLILFRIVPLKALFEKDSQAAFHLVSEISRGIQTRTRKSDYGTWIAKDTFGMLTLEGSRRVRFLLSRVTLYITKDLSTSFPSPVKANELLVGYATYPGTARQPDDLLREAEENLEPYS